MCKQLHILYEKSSFEELLSSLMNENPAGRFNGAPKGGLWGRVQIVMSSKE
jgi:hypothetical protein